MTIFFNQYPENENKQDVGIQEAEETKFSSPITAKIHPIRQKKNKNQTHTAGKKQIL